MAIAVTALVAFGGWPMSRAEGANPATQTTASPPGPALVRIPPPADNLVEFGSSVAISGGTAVVVASSTLVPDAQGVLQGQQGQAFIYTSSGGAWSSTPVATLTAPSASGQFGSAVAVSGNTVVVSDPNASPGGSVYLYTEGSGGWPATPTLTLTDPAWYPGDPWKGGFGLSLAMAGSTLLVGSPGGYGWVYEYTEASSGWPAAPTLTLSAPTSHGCFGTAGLSLSGTTALIGGGCDRPSSGVVYVYKLRKSGWSSEPVATFLNPVSRRNTDFGTVETVSGGTALVSASGFNRREGRIYVYTKARNGAWHTTPTAVIADPTATPGDWFGEPLALSDGVAIIGAVGADQNSSTGGSGLSFLYRT